MRFFSLLVVLVLSVNLTVQSEEVKAPATITKLNDEIKNKLCVQLKNYFVKYGYKLVIAVGEFPSSPKLDANYSNGIKKTITDELIKIDFKVDTDADYFLEGKYSKITNNDNSISLNFNFSLNNSSSNVLVSQFPITINDGVEVATLTGTTAGLGNQPVAPMPADDVKSNEKINSKENKEKINSKEDKEKINSKEDKEKIKSNYLVGLPNGEEINKKIAKDSVTPSFYLNLNRNLIRTNESSPYGVKILVKDGKYFNAIPIRKNDQGRPFVDLKKGDIYRIELINDSKYEAAAEVLIDGLNTHNFSETRDPVTKSHKYKYIIIDKHDSRVVKGWEKNDDEVYEFLTNAYGKDNPQKNLKPVYETGVITVKFYVSYEENDKPFFIPNKLSGDKLDTVQGKVVEGKTTPVDRLFGPVIDTISIRYSH